MGAEGSPRCKDEMRTIFCGPQCGVGLLHSSHLGGNQQHVVSLLHLRLQSRSCSEISTLFKHSNLRSACF